MKINVEYVVHKSIEVEVKYTDKDFRKAEDDDWTYLVQETYDVAYEAVKKHEETEGFDIVEMWSDKLGDIWIGD